MKFENKTRKDERKKLKKQIATRSDNERNESKIDQEGEQIN